MKAPHQRQVVTDIYDEIKPIKYKGYEIPHQFTATFYLMDNDNVEVTKENFKTFKTWQVKFYIRVTKAETVEVVKTEILGASTYKGHDMFSKKPVDPFAYGTVQARHYVALRDYRARFVSIAVQVALQSHKFTKKADGSFEVTIGDKIEIPETELSRINFEVTENAYAKLDDAFYLYVAEIYNREILEGNPRPNLVLMQTLNKELKTVQGYTKVCRVKKYILEAKEKGKASPAKEPPTKKEKGKSNGKTRKK